MQETNELRRLVEAVLFASARAMSIEELSKICKRSENDILAVLTLWQKELEQSNSPTRLEEDNNGWKLTVSEKYIPIVKKVVTKTELPKTILETLAIVAYKSPVMQSKVVKLRTNKAYDHLSFLEQAGFITREKHGRTKIIRLTQKFYDYFSIDPSKLKEKFRKMGDLEQAIEAKEKEHEEIKESQQEEAKATYDAVETVEKLEPTGVETYNDTLGKLETYGETENVTETKKTEETKEKQTTEEERPADEKSEAKSESEVHEDEKPENEKSEKPKLTSEERFAEEVKERAGKAKKREFSTKGLYPEGMPPEMEKKVDERVKEMLEGEKE